MKKLCLILSVLFLSFSVYAQEKTVVNDAKAKAMLLGRHQFSLQWIDFWKYFGAATVTNRGGVFYLKGEQRERGGSDFVTIDGIVTRIDGKEFKFDGKIITQVSTINGGAPCERSGVMTFKITGTRKYWRLQEMQNPCDGVTDYVDIFFR